VGVQTMNRAVRVRVADAGESKTDHSCGGSRASATGSDAGRKTNRPSRWNDLKQTGYLTYDYQEDKNVGLRRSLLRLPISNAIEPT